MSLSFVEAFFTESIIVTSILGIIIAYLFYNKSSPRNNDNGIYQPMPTATNAQPILGHALHYKNNPPQFLMQQQSILKSPIFRINLAGRKMIIVGSDADDAEITKQIVTAKRSVLCAREAVANVGFEYTLGPKNVYDGTDLHKLVIKTYFGVKNEKTRGEYAQKEFQAFQNAFDMEVSKLASTAETKRVNIEDFFTFCRKCFLRQNIEIFLGKALLQKIQSEEEENNSFITHFLSFQDKVEDATAKAAILPRFISLPLVLWPMKRFRIKIQNHLVTLLEDIMKEENEQNLGPWLLQFRKQHVNADEAAELILGLLFASHKNPSIGCAQAFMNLKTYGSSIEQEGADKESKSILASSKIGLQHENLEKICPNVHHCVLETLRLTAHTIGAIRFARQDFVLETKKHGKMLIRKEETIAITHIVPNLDVKLWGDDANVYNPNRKEWTMTSKQEGKGGKINGDNADDVDEYKFTTFSQGIHKCPGQRIAEVCICTMLALLLAHDAQIVGDVPDISFERATLAQREGLVQVSLATTQQL